MALALVGGALLGAAAGELLKAIISFKKRAGAFKSRFEHLQSSLETLVPKLVGIEELYKKRGQEHEIAEFVRILTKGTVLVKKCTKVHSLNIYLKPKFSKELQKLDHSIVRFCSVELPLQTNRTVMEISIATEQLSRKFDTFLSHGRSSANENGLGLPLSLAPPRPPSTIGLDVPLRELKIKLKESESVLVLCGPGWCGKTTLAKVLCHDPEIQETFGGNIFFLTLSKVPNESALDYLKLTHMDVNSSKLLVLDDVWPGSEHLIERFSYEVPGLKILVTSRFEFRRYRSLYKLKLLSPEDATKLFCDSAFHPNDSRPDAELLHKIIKSCCGFPIALTMVGKSLNGQPWVLWEERARKMSKVYSIFNSGDFLLRLLKLSIDDLSFFKGRAF